METVYSPLRRSYAKLSIMPVVRLFHWKAAEAQPLIDAIRKAGYEVAYPGDEVGGNLRAVRELQPHALVIDLSHQPSHGRWLVRSLRAQKSTRSFPVVFVDGDPEKVAKIREELPDAIYTSRARLGAALKKAKPIANPVSPAPMMASYGNRTTAQKMGIKDGTRVAVIDAPPGYARAIGVLPSGVVFEEDPQEVLPVTIWFVHDPDTYLASLPRMRKLAEAKSKLWIVWPKAASAKAARSGVTQYLIREGALEFGLVDSKVCSVSDAWSGMLFTRKR